MKGVSKVAPALATGALSTLGSLGIDKIFGKGLQSGGFMVPQNKVDQLIKYKDWLYASQKKQILTALQTGSGVVIKPTEKQRGGFLGTLLASIGVPLLLNALTGLTGLSTCKGLQVDRQRSRRSLPVYISPSTSEGGLINPYAMPPPFIGTWKNPIGLGVKKKLPKEENQKRGKGFY